MKRLVLLGGGWAHLQVLHALAQERLAGAEVLLLTPHPALLHAGMLPGLVAGHYRAAQCRIALAPWAAAAGVAMVEATVVGLDAAARKLQLSDGRTAEYDVLSINAAAVQRRDTLPGAREHGLFLHPMEHFVQLQDALLDLAARRVLDVVVLGSGAAAFELALALQHWLSAGGEERARIALVTGGPEPLAGLPQAALRAGARLLARRRITVFREAAAGVQAGAVLLASGARLACDAPLIATAAEAPPWLAASGLALCERGFVRTGATLQSTSHPAVFAADDDAMDVGPALAENLRRYVGGGQVLAAPATARTLQLLSCGDRSALAVWSRWCGQGRWAWWCKDRRDRKRMARFAVPTLPSA